MDSKRLVEQSGIISICANKVDTSRTADVGESFIDELQEGQYQIKRDRG